MFFILSKVLSFLLKPLLWVAVLLLWALITKKNKQRKGLLIAGFLSLYFFSNPFITNLLVRWWEENNNTIQHPDYRQYDAFIVLGGFIGWDGLHARIEVNKSIDRLFYGLRGLKENKYLIISGGSGSLLDQKHKEAIMTAQLLADISVDTAHVIMETESRNSYENLLNSSTIAGKKGLSKILVITSAFHVPRIKLIMKKLNLPYDILGVDSKQLSDIAPDDYLVPAADAIVKWEILLREWVGIIAYKLTGKA